MKIQQNFTGPLLVLLFFENLLFSHFYMVKRDTNLVHMVLFPVGAAYSFGMAYRDRLTFLDERLSNLVFSICNYSFAMILLFSVIFGTNRNTLTRQHKIFGSLFISACSYLFLYRLSDLEIFHKLSIFTQHYILGYFLVGSIFVWDRLPLVSIFAKELSPNSHWDFKMGYLALNIFIYSTHTYSLHFFNSQLELAISDYGYFGCLSFFYIANTIIGPYAERNKSTKKATIFLSILSTLIYSIFVVIRMYKERLGNLFTICTVFSAYVIVLSPIFPLYDVLVLHHLSKEYKEMALAERKEIFTRIRLWASIGHAISGLVISYVYKVLDTTGKSVKEDSSLQFFVLIGVVLACTVIFVGIVYFSLEEKTDISTMSFKRKMPKVEKEKSEKEHSELTALGELAEERPPQNLLKDGNFLFLIFVITAIGATRGISSHYLVTYLSVYFGVEFSKVTSILCIRTISEMGILYYSKHLLKYFGYYWLLFFSLLSATLRDFNYAFLSKSNPIIFATANEVFKGISSSCLIFSAVNIVDELAENNNKALAQTFYSGFYNGISILVSSVLSLLIIRYFKDFRALFHVSSTIGFICCCIVILKYGFIDKKLYFRRKPAACIK